MAFAFEPPDPPDDLAGAERPLDDDAAAERFDDRVDAADERERLAVLRLRGFVAALFALPFEALFALPFEVLFARVVLRPPLADRLALAPLEEPLLFLDDELRELCPDDRPLLEERALA